MALVDTTYQALPRAVLASFGVGPILLRGAAWLYREEPNQIGGQSNLHFRTSLPEAS